MHLHEPNERITSADEALKMLKEGNARYLKGELCAKDDYKEERDVLSKGQVPYAVILCCSDSRVAPEIYFDERLGDIFVIRNAGNVIDEVVMGSIEYGAEHLGSPLIVVVGHTSCGAVTAACEGGDLPRNISAIVRRIQPSIQEGMSVDEVAIENAKAMAKQIADDEMIRHCGTKVVSALYDILSGEVKWLSE
ncbi:MAG: carbonic anhydrase [Solobacterium sp.]|nr:carbonic anhydrase [Solobacterium sp.]